MFKSLTKTQTIFLSIIILILLSAFLGFEFFSNRQVVLKGQIKEAGTNKPLSKTMVVSADTIIFTDKNGNFSFKTIPGNKELIAKKIGYKSAVKNIRLGFLNKTVNIALLPLYAQIKGKVINKKTGEGVSSVQVRIAGSIINTDSNGNFKGFADLGPALLTIKIGDKKLLSKNIQVTNKNNFYSLKVTVPDNYRIYRELSGPDYYPVFDSITPEVIYHGNRNEKKVALTLDDGWKPDPRILQLLNHYNIKITTFLIGDRGIVDKHPKWVKGLDKNGFEVADHTYDHHLLAHQGEYEDAISIKKGQVEVSKVIHKQYPYFRPPGGDYNRMVVNLAASNGFKVIMWDVTIADTVPGLTVDREVKTALDHVQNGSIILAHWGGYHTYAALSTVIPELLNRGFKITTVSDVLQGHTPEKIIYPGQGKKTYQ